MAEFGDLEITINTNVKNDISMTATNEDIIKALRQVIDLPDNIMALELKLKIDEVPLVATTKWAMKPKEEN